MYKVKKMRINLYGQMSVNLLNLGSGIAKPVLSGDPRGSFSVHLIEVPF